jgi:hypothetical protein
MPNSAGRAPPPPGRAPPPASAGALARAKAKQASIDASLAIQQKRMGNGTGNRFIGVGRAGDGGPVYVQLRFLGPLRSWVEIMVADEMGSDTVGCTMRRTIRIGCTSREDWGDLIVMMIVGTTRALGWEMEMRTGQTMM